MKTKIIVTTLVSILLVAFLLCSCAPLVQSFTLHYEANNGGYIQGETEQTVEKGSDGSAVIAVATSGYEFSGWSDGNRYENRDMYVQDAYNLCDGNNQYTLYAIFEKIA